MAHRYEQQSKKDGDQGSSATIITPDNQGGMQISDSLRSQDRERDAGERQTPGRTQAQSAAPSEDDRSDQESGQRRASLPMAWPVSPFGMMNRMLEEMDRFFEDFGLGRSRLMPRMRDVVGVGQRGLGSM